ncbi:hypothetical protein XELAEV_18018920mg [Xenopus laevis]|uniref:Uncharacterized protein n=1 Tax=Xenopus laevis TaxID=8355 RepID=A0A974DDX8_XENLA|nr:hypothetical protein XELAEV_18018920mg [Xenopus laevis]
MNGCFCCQSAMQIDAPFYRYLSTLLVFIAGTRHFLRIFRIGGLAGDLLPPVNCCKAKLILGSKGQYSPCLSYSASPAFCLLLCLAIANPPAACKCH